MTAHEGGWRGFAWRGALALLLVSFSTGCMQERAAHCSRVAKALVTPQPKKAQTSRADELLLAAREFTAAAGRLAAIGPLSPELDAIAKAVQRELGNASAAIEAAATARKAVRQPDYAAARQRAEDARRALLELSTRFAQLCAR